MKKKIYTSPISNVGKFPMHHPSDLVFRYNQRIHEQGMSSVESMRIMNEERNELLRKGEWNPSMDFGLLYPEMLKETYDKVKEEREGNIHP